MTTNTTTESGSQGNAGPDVKTASLDKSISDALDIFDKLDVTPATVEAANNEDETTSESVSKADIPEVAEASTENADENETAEKADILTPPENWPNERKKVFETLSPDAKKAWLEHSKDYERGLSKQGEKFAEQRRNWEAVETNLKAVEPLIAQTGMSKTQFVGQVVNGYVELLRNPVAQIQAFMQQAGIKPEQLFPQTQQKEETQQQWVDPEVKKLKEEFSKVEQRSKTMEAHIAETQRVAQVDQMAVFLNNVPSMKDETGNALYPHFDEEMAETMHHIIQSTPAINTVTDPRQKFHMAYKLAVGENHAKIVEKEMAKRQAEKEAEKARTAKTIKPSHGSNGNAVKGKMSLDEIIANSLSGI